MIHGLIIDSFTTFRFAVIDFICLLNRSNNLTHIEFLVKIASFLIDKSNLMICYTAFIKSKSNMIIINASEIKSFQ